MMQKILIPESAETPLKATPEVKAPDVEVTPEPEKEIRGFAIIEPDVETAQPVPERKRYHAPR